MPTFSVIAMLALAVTFLSLGLSLGEGFESGAWVPIVIMSAVTTALFSVRIFSTRSLSWAESIPMLTLLVVTSCILSACLLLAKGIGKRSMVSTLALWATLVIFFSIWLFA